jgi:hypothetical protein
MSRANSFLIVLAIGFSLLLGAVAGGAPAVLVNWLSPARSADERPQGDLMARLASPTPSQTPQPSPTSTRPPTVTVTASPTAVVATPAPRATRTPTATPTTAPSPTAETSPTVTDEEVPDEPERVLVQVVVEGNLNVRGGPGLEYPTIGFVSTGMEGEALGRNTAGTWVFARLPEGGLTGWINASPSFIAITGDLSTMPITEPGS